MKAVLEAKDDRGKDRANVYRGGLQAKFDEGADPATLIEWVKSEGGIDAAYRKSLKPNEAKPDQSTEPKASDNTRSADDECDEEDEQEVVAKTNSAEGKDERESENGIFSRVIGRLNRMRGRGTKPILVAARSAEFDKVMGRYADAGEVNLRCTLTRKPDGWIEVTCTKVSRGISKR